MDEPFGVNHPGQGLVDGWDKGRQRQKVGLFHKKGGLGAHAKRALDFGIGHVGAPLKGLEVEIKPVGKGSARQEVSLCIGKKSLDVSFPVGVSDPMGHKSGAEDLCQGLHLGSNLCIGTSAVGNKDTGVVDGASLRGAVHEAEGLGEKVSGLEAGEAGIVLDENPSAVGEDEGRATGGNCFVAQKEFMGGGVVLSFLSRCEAVGADPVFDVAFELGLAHQMGEGAVGDIQAVLFLEQLPDSDHIALAPDQELCGKLGQLFVAL